MQQEVLLYSDAVEEALSYIAYAMFSMFHTAVENSQLYTLGDEEVSGWLELTELQLETRRLPILFSEVPLKVIEVPDLIRLQV